MKRTRDQAFAPAVRPECNVLELLLAAEEADARLLWLLFTVGDIDFRDFRRLARVCRRLSWLANRVLSSGAYNVYLYTVTPNDGDDEYGISQGKCHPPLKGVNVCAKLQEKVATQLKIVRISPPSNWTLLTRTPAIGGIRAMARLSPSPLSRRRAPTNANASGPSSRRSSARPLQVACCAPSSSDKQTICCLSAHEPCPRPHFRARWRP